MVDQRAVRTPDRRDLSLNTNGVYHEEGCRSFLSHPEPLDPPGQRGLDPVPAVLSVQPRPGPLKGNPGVPDIRQFRPDEVAGPQDLRTVAFVESPRKLALPGTDRPGEQDDAKVAGISQGQPKRSGAAAFRFGGKS